MKKSYFVICTATDLLDVDDHTEKAKEDKGEDNGKDRESGNEEANRKDRNAENNCRLIRVGIEGVEED